MTTMTERLTATAVRTAVAAALALAAWGTAPTPAAAEPPESARASSPPPAGRVVIISRGDSLSRLAKRHGVPVEAIRAANGMQDTRLTAGLTLIIPGAAPVARAPKTYTVRAGDSLYVIAGRFAIAHQELARANGLTDPKALQPGQVLKIPERRPPWQTAGTPPVKRLGPAREMPVSQPARADPQDSRGAGAAAASQPRPSGRAPGIAPLAAETPSTHAAAVLPLPRTALSAALAAPAAAPLASAPEPIAPVDPVIEGIVDLEARLPSARPGETGFRWPVVADRIVRAVAAVSPLPRVGLTIAAPRGTPVAAARSGVVAYAGNELSAYGNLVLVRHTGDWLTAYAHNRTLHVKRGDAVQRGQIIATVGQTGSAREPQLRFELWKGARPVDPLAHLMEN